MNSLDRSIRFGEGVDQGLEYEKVFPFHYSFVNLEDDTWLPDALTLAGNLAGIGPVILPGATVNHHIRLDPDYLFKLHYLQYSVYTIVGAQYQWYDQPAGFFLQQGNIDVIGTRLIDSLSVTLLSQTDGKFLYGGSRTDLFSGNAAEHPYFVGNTQGFLEGLGTVRIDYMFPRSGIVTLKLTNNHPTMTLYTAGVLAGVKVRV